MVHQRSFDDVLEAIDQLSTEDQETVMEIVRRRIADRGRKRLIADIQESQREFEEGTCSPSTADELLGEILS